MNSHSGLGLVLPSIIAQQITDYVILSDAEGRLVIGSNLLSPQLKLFEEKVLAESQQDQLNGLASPAISGLQNLKSALVKQAMITNGNSESELIRFRDDRGHWRYGQIESSKLVGSTGNGEAVCTVLTLLKYQHNLIRQQVQRPSKLLWAVDMRLELQYISPEFKQLGFEDRLIMGSNRLPFLSQDSRDFLLALVEDMQNHPVQDSRVVSQSLRTRDGVPIAATIQYNLLFAENGELTGVLGKAEFFPSREQLESERQLFSAVFEAMSEGLFITDSQGHIIKANAALCDLTGYSEQELTGAHCSILWRAHYGPEFFKKINDRLSQSSLWKEEVLFQRADGRARPGFLSFCSTLNVDHEIQNYVGTLIDIAEQKKNERFIHRLEYYDPLTGLANRRMFCTRLEEIIAQVTKQNSGLAVLFIDLDRFKPVNDSWGHRVGDQLLRQIALRLKQILSDTEVLARVGADEFAILIQASDIEFMHQAAVRMATSVQAQFRAPIQFEEREIFASASIGIALYPGDGHSAESMLRNADTAMVAAKNSGYHSYQFYDRKMHKDAKSRLTMENALRRALINESLELSFQPQFSIRSGAMSGIEVLARWTHSELGEVKPTEFIPLAEQTGLIIPLGDWVFQHTCEKIAHWRSLGISFDKISVNVSVFQFKRNDFADWVLFQLRRHQIDPASIELEITESALMENIDQSVQILTRLKASKLRIAIDDFGTGYSSLNYLRKLPVDTLKIDRVFVEDIVNNENTWQLTKNMIAIAKSLRMSVVVEGVENWEQYRLLRGFDCDEVQGHIMSKPLKEESLINLVTKTPKVGA